MARNLERKSSMPDLSWLRKKPADHILEKENESVSMICVVLLKASL